MVHSSRATTEHLKKYRKTGRSKTNTCVVESISQIEIRQHETRKPDQPLFSDLSLTEAFACRRVAVSSNISEADFLPSVEDEEAIAAGDAVSKTGLAVSKTSLAAF